MRRLRWLPLAAAALLLVQPSVAEELIYFTNGTYMPIRSHEVIGDMVHVDLGENGFIAFPLFLVDKLEGADGIKLKPSTAKPGRSGRMIASSGPTGGGDEPFERDPTAIQSRNPGTVSDEPVNRDRFGMVIGSHPGRGGLTNAQRPGVLRGAMNEGNRYVMDAGNGRLSRRARPVGLAVWDAPQTGAAVPSPQPAPLEQDPNALPPEEVDHYATPPDEQQRDRPQDPDSD